MDLTFPIVIVIRRGLPATPVFSGETAAASLPRRADDKDRAYLKQKVLTGPVPVGCSSPFF